jgi:hypothetical protein
MLILSSCFRSDRVTFDEAIGRRLRNAQDAPR